MRVQGVYDVVRQNPELGESVLSLLVSHVCLLAFEILYNQGLVVGFVINVDNYNPLFFIRL